jgi:hypothetical protein
MHPVFLALKPHSSHAFENWSDPHYVDHRVHQALEQAISSELKYEAAVQKYVNDHFIPNSMADRALKFPFWKDFGQSDRLHMENDPQLTDLRHGVRESDLKLDMLLNGLIPRPPKCCCCFPKPTATPPVPNGQPVPNGPPVPKPPLLPNGQPVPKPPLLPNARVSQVTPLRLGMQACQAFTNILFAPNSNRSKTLVIGDFL